MASSTPGIARPAATLVNAAASRTRAFGKRRARSARNAGIALEPPVVTTSAISEELTDARTSTSVMSASVSVSRLSMSLSKRPRVMRASTSTAAWWYERIDAGSLESSHLVVSAVRLVTEDSRRIAREFAFGGVRGHEDLIPKLQLDCASQRGELAPRRALA